MEKVGILKEEMERFYTVALQLRKRSLPRGQPSDVGLWGKNSRTKKRFSGLFLELAIRAAELPRDHTHGNYSYAIAPASPCSEGWFAFMAGGARVDRDARAVAGIDSGSSLLRGRERKAMNRRTSLLLMRGRAAFDWGREPQMPARGGREQVCVFT